MGTRAPAVHLRSGLRTAGYDDDEVRRLVRAGALARVRRGAYLRSALPDDRAVRHLAAIHAASAQLSDEAVVSHISGAVLRGWDVWNVPLLRVRVTRGRRTGGRVHPSVHVRTAPLCPEDLELIDGVPVTRASRIVVDVARTVPFEQAVVVADCALARGDVDAAALVETMARQKGWPGAPAARRAPPPPPGMS